MGYTTDFFGELEISPPIKQEHADYINKFNDTRRMKRNEFVATYLDDPVRQAAGLPVGEQGCFFVGGIDYKGQGRDASVIEDSYPPAGQPGLWCQWRIEEGHLVWDGGEKFYYYEEWLEYLIANFFGPWGYTLNGSIDWYGEDSDDRGVIFVKDNMVESVGAVITQPGPSWEKDDLSAPLGG